MLIELSIATIGKFLAKPIFDFVIQRVFEKNVFDKVFPKDTFKIELIKTIYSTIDKFEKAFPYDKKGNQFPFYHSQLLFEYLSMYVLFNEQIFTSESIEQELKKNPNIIKPSIEEIEKFYDLFQENAHKNESLKTLFVEENYKQRIFDIYENLAKIENKLDEIITKTNEISKGLEKLQRLEVINPIQTEFKQTERSLSFLLST